MNKKSISDLIKKIADIPYIALIIFLAFYLLNYGYYIFVLSLPEDSHDTIQYANTAMLIISNKLPISYLHIDIPMGYPLFLALIYSLGGTIETVVLAQLIIFILACLFLIRQVTKINNVSGLILSIFMSLWAADNSIMRESTRLVPDSLYCSALILIAAFFIRFYLVNKKSSYILLFSGILLASLIRSNGPYLFFLPLVMIVIEIFYKNYKRCLLIAGYSLLIVICLSSLNFFFKGYFFPGDFNRIKNVITQLDEKSKPDPNQVNPEKRAKPLLFSDYMFYMRLEKKSFYYGVLPARYSSHKKYYCRDCIEKMNLGNNTDSVINFIWKGYTIDGINKEHFDKVTNYEHKPRSVFPYINHVINKLDHILLHKSYLIFALYWLLTFFAIYKLFIKDKKRFSWLILLIISSINILPVIILTFGHTRFQLRYINVSEFIFYLFIVLALTLLISKNPLFILKKGNSIQEKEHQ